MNLTDEQVQLVRRLEQSRNNGTGLMLRDPASVGLLHQLIVDLTQKNDDWISVEDRYPDCCHRVLCKRPDKFIVIGKAIVGTDFCHFQGDDGLNLTDVTHWQPLPEPPK